MKDVEEGLPSPVAVRFMRQNHQPGRNKKGAKLGAWAHIACHDQKKKDVRKKSKEGKDSLTAPVRMNRARAGAKGLTWLVRRAP